MSDAPLVVRPRRLTRVCIGVALLVVAVFAGVGWGLTRSEGEAGFRTADAVAMTGLGVLLGGAALSFTRARVVAGVDGVRVRNVLTETALPWEVVRAVRFDEGASWASLELQDDDTVALLAVQANDGDRAVDAVVELRRLLARSREQRG
ncbi:MAG TPA: PH domain-containing protein [Mycobacteriales bacterium]|nr:PH domain-containing protein [Mycobacteriales bacterium]